MTHRLAAPLLIVIGLFVVFAVPASAHVTVGSDDATQGGFSVLTFRVPNEESNADTVGIKVQLPADHPIPFVSVQPKPGWSFKTKTTKLDKPVESEGGSITEAVSEIEWTGGKIAPGEFEQFLIQAGPLPTDTDSLTFKAIQTYQDADGKTHDVAWIQESQPGQSEPEHPAPVLALAPASAGGHGAADTTSDDAPTVTAAAADSESATQPQAKSSSSDNGLSVFAMAFGAAGLVMAIIALVLAVAARQKVTQLGAGQGRSSPNSGD